MRWVLLWVVLVLAAGVVLGLLGRSLWRKAMALTREMGEASERLSAVAASLADLAEQAEAAAHPPAAAAPPPAARRFRRGGRDRRSRTR